MVMNRIILHHSGGPGKISSLDRKHYHKIVDADGKIHDGDHPISHNAPGKSLKNGSYAAHTAGLNTGSIGLSIAAMAGASWNDPRGSTNWFPTPAQVRAFVKEAARLAHAYGIPVTRETVLSHAEVQGTLGVKQAGKWDFDYDPIGNNESRDPVIIGDLLRAMIRQEMANMPAASQSANSRPLLKRGSTGDYVKELQRHLGLHADGIFGPRTEDAVTSFQKSHNLLPDGKVGSMTWAALTSKG